MVKRLLEHDTISYTIAYDQKLIRNQYHRLEKRIDVDPITKQKLKNIQKKYKIHTYNEVIWRVMYNEQNRKR